MRASRFEFGPRRAVAASALLAAWLSACDNDDPVQPRAALSGSVRLTVRQTDLVGQPLADILELQVDGVAVALQGDDNSRRTTLTVDGRFTFDELPPARYVASIGIDETIRVSSGPVDVVQGEVELADTLTLSSTPALRTFPNPFQELPGLAIECTTAVAGPVEFEIFSPARTAVWHHAYTGPAGVQHVHWAGDDEQLQPLPDGLYWVVVRKGTEVEYSLVRKTSP